MSEEEEPEAGADRDAEAPETSGKSEVNGNRVSLIVGGVILLIGGLVVWPMVLRQKKAADRTKAIGNCKQIGLCLLEFDREFGCFPDEKTVTDVKRSSKSSLDLSGSSSNALFRQLIAYGIRSEDIFYCVHPEGIHKPDRDMSPGKALEAGEVGYSYVAGLKTEMNPGISVVMAPMKLGTETFWLEPYDNKAVILRLDNSVEAPLIRNRDGKASVGNGRTLFDTGPETVWGEGFEIDLRHPEK